MSKINHDTSEPNIFLINFSLITSCLIIAAIFIWCFYYYKAAVSNEQNIKEITGTPQNRLEVEIYEEETLNNLKWTDETRKTAKIPLNEAKTIILNQYNK